ncbi:hypothetical protein IAU60_004180 [Kwoniella sp. DSM 27419]
MYPFVGAYTQTELSTLKSAPVLDPNFGMVTKYLECLNQLADQLFSIAGPPALPAWLGEVQCLLRLLQKRIFQGIHLTPLERASIVRFADYWRQMVQPPYCMGRPEAQIVLLYLAEIAGR